MKIAVISFFFLFCSWLKGQTLTPFQKDGQWGIRDERGKTILEPQFKEIGEIKSAEGIIPVKNQHGKWGFWKWKELLLECQFDNFRFTKVNTLLVQQHTRWGIYTLEGRCLLPCRYKYINHLDAHVYKAGLYNQWTLRSFSNEIKTRYEYDSLWYMGDNILKFCQVGNYGLMDMKGTVITTENTDLFLSMQPLQAEKIKTKPALVKPEESFKPTGLAYEKVFPFREGFARYLYQRKYGFIDRQSNIRLVPQYEDAGDFSESMVAIKLMGKWGFMDTLERLRVQPYYDQVWNFQNGVALVREGNTFNFVNKDGRPLYETSFERITPTPFGRYILQKNGKFGLADSHGKEMVSTKYERIEELPNRYILAMEHGLFGVLDPQGNQVVAFNYSVLQYDWDHQQILCMEPGGEIRLEIQP
ncbi:MAG: WG repeat-containing protein [Cytophagaceae bacterium]|jgi:hypothetical protein|nr:WG repeat-containing protein [Cytophagaceae bacterium]